MSRQMVIETQPVARLDPSAAPESLLKLNAVSSGYDESLILRSVGMEVAPNQVVALLGRNGVGKTTLLRTIMGIVPTLGGAIHFDGKSIHKLSSDRRARLGIGYVPQGRDIFPSLTVWENLKVSLAVSGSRDPSQLEEVYELFPVIKEMLHRRGGVLSGGQQQQLAIARALLLKPKLLILDEPTEGIQPSIIDQIEDAIQIIKKKYRMSIILVEQYLDFAKAVSDRFYIIDRGLVVQNGPTDQLTDELIAQYLTV